MYWPNPEYDPHPDRCKWVELHGRNYEQCWDHITVNDFCLRHHRMWRNLERQRALYEGREDPWAEADDETAQARKLRYRRNADTKLRKLERTYQEQGDLSSLRTLNAELFRIGQVENLIPISPSEMASYLRQKYPRSSESRWSAISFEAIPRFTNDNFGERFPAFEIKRNILRDDIDGSTITAIMAELERDIISLGWLSIFPALNIKVTDSTRYSIESFLGHGHSSFSFIEEIQNIPNLEDAMAKLGHLEPDDEPWDDYDLRKLEQIESSLLHGLQQAQLYRKMIIFSSNLGRTQEIEVTPPLGHRMIASWRQKDEQPDQPNTAYDILAERTKMGPYDGRYATFRYYPQGGFNGAHGPYGGGYDIRTYLDAIKNFGCLIFKIGKATKLQ